MLKPFTDQPTREADFCAGQPAVSFPDDWARDLEADRKASWREFHGHAHGEADIVPGSLTDQRAATIWGVAGEPKPGSLIWLHGVTGFIEVVHHENLHYRFCG